MPQPFSVQLPDDDYTDDLETEEYDAGELERKATLSGWGLSLAIHGLVALILMFVVVTARLVRNDPLTRHVVFETIEVEEDDEDIDHRALEKVDVTIVHDQEVTDKQTIITDLEVDIADIPTTEDMEPHDDAKGREDAVSDMELGNEGAFMAIGVGGGGKGPWGRIEGGDDRKAADAYGPNARKAKSALEAALRWLVRHQSEDGKWDSDAYNLNCNLAGPKCEPGRNVGGADEALTGYALLCFLGAGYDHKVPNRYQATIRKAIAWILRQQQENGLIGRRNYEHPVCAMALAEAYAMTMDDDLQLPAQKAINVVLERQVKDGDSYGLGWDYVSPKLNRMDSSVSGWNVMALKSAKAGGLEVENGLGGAKRWLEKAWQAANPDHASLDPYDKSVFPYTWNGQTNETKRNHLSFVGALCAVFLGHNRGDVILETLSNDIDERWFDNEKYKTNSYCLYYASLAQYQVGGKHWEDKWGHPEKGYLPWLIDTQDKEGGCHDGTWPHGGEKWHGGDTSPVLTHVYKTLALEVAFRYLPLATR